MEPAGLRISGALIIPERDLQWRFSRSSGPGGQKVNTADTRVELSYDVTLLPSLLRDRALNRLSGRLVDGVLTITASDQRSQWRNREAAAARLAAVLRDAIAAPPKARRPTRPSRAARLRRLEDKRRRGGLKRERRVPPEEG